MNSPRRRQDKPVKFVSLTITFRATKEEATGLKREFPSMAFRNGICKIKIAADTPETAIERTRKLLEMARVVR